MDHCSRFDSGNYRNAYRSKTHRSKTYHSDGDCDPDGGEVYVGALWDEKTARFYQQVCWSSPFRKRALQQWREYELRAQLDRSKEKELKLRKGREKRLRCSSSRSDRTTPSQSYSHQSRNATKKRDSVSSNKCLRQSRSRVRRNRRKKRRGWCTVRSGEKRLEEMCNQSAGDSACSQASDSKSKDYETHYTPKSKGDCAHPRSTKRRANKNKLKKMRCNKKEQHPTRCKRDPTKNKRSHACPTNHHRKKPETKKQPCYKRSNRNYCRPRNKREPMKKPNKPRTNPGTKRMKPPVFCRPQRTNKTAPRMPKKIYWLRSSNRAKNTDDFMEFLKSKEGKKNAKNRANTARSKGCASTKKSSSLGVSLTESDIKCNCEDCARYRKVFPTDKLADAYSLPFP